MKTAQTTVRQTTGRIGGLICFLAVVLFAAALKFYPAFQGFLLSFQEYTPLYGMTNSPWVGTQNYDQLLNGPYFYSILKNSFVLGFLANLIPIAVGFLLGWPLAKFSGGKTVGLFLGIWLLPVFLPAQMYTSTAVWLGGADLLGNPFSAVLVYMAAAGIRTLCFSVFLCGICGYLCKRSGASSTKGSLLGGGVLLMISAINLLTPSLEILHGIQNPLNYEATDTLDTYAYRTGLMNASFSPSAAAWCVKLLLELPFFLIAVILFLCVLKSVPFRREAGSIQESTSLPGVFSLIAVGIFSIFAMALFISLLPGESPDFGIYAANSTLISLFTAVLFFGFLLLFGYGSASRPAAGIALGGLLLWVSCNTVGEYLFYRQAYAINTPWPVILNGVFLPTLLIPFLVIGALIFQAHPCRSFGDWIRRMLPFLLLFTGLSMANAWGSGEASVIYISDNAQYGLSIALRNALLSGNTGIVAPIGIPDDIGFTGVCAVFCIVPFCIGVLSVILFTITDLRSADRTAG